MIEKALDEKLTDLRVSLENDDLSEATKMIKDLRAAQSFLTVR